MSSEQFVALVLGLLAGNGVIAAVITHFLNNDRANKDAERTAKLAQAAAKAEAEDVLEQQGLKRIADLEAERDRQQKEIDRLTGRVMELADEAKRLARDAEDRKAERDELKRRVGEFTELLEAKEARLRAREEVEKQLTQKVMSLSDQIKIAQLQIDELKTANAELTKNRAALEGENARLTKELAALQAEHTKLRAELETLKAQTNGHDPKGEYP